MQVNMTSENKFVQMIDNIAFSNIPGEILIKTKLCILDYLGVLLAGKATKYSRQMKRILFSQSDYQDPSDIALWVGSIARITDLDDGHRFAMGHPGVPIISTALAISVSKKVSGKEFIEAVVKGYEAYCFLGRVINPSAYRSRGFDSTGICGAIGAAVTAGSIFKLNKEKISIAINIAGSLCGGLTQYFENGASTKFLCSGWAASLGVTAAKLAPVNFISRFNILSGENGYCQAFSNSYNEEYLRNAVVQWEIGNVYFKEYGCVRRVHPALDCVRSIYKKNNISHNNIEKIIVYGGKFVAKSAKYEPINIVDAQSSLPFCIAVFLYYGSINLFLIEKGLNNHKVMELLHKIVIIEDEKLNILLQEDPSCWGAVSVVLMDINGNKYIQNNNLAEGENENPFSEEKLENKFLDLASKQLGRKEAHFISEKVKILEKCSDMKSLIKRII